VIMTPFERAKIRLEAFQLLAGWGTNTGNPEAENPLDRYVGQRNSSRC
jgi:hypothetical protein